MEIGGQRSTEAEVTFGVPQGSLLGPMICLRFLAVEIWKCLPMIQPFIVLEI